jgi:hypothetical protein
MREDGRSFDEAGAWARPHEIDAAESGPMKKSDAFSMIGKMGVVEHDESTF